MTILRRALWLAAKRAAADPLLRAKAGEFARDELAPRVHDAVERARPAAERARQRAAETVSDLRETAAEHPPLDDPDGFVRAARTRLKDRKRPG